MLVTHGHQHGVRTDFYLSQRNVRRCEKFEWLILVCNRRSGSFAAHGHGYSQTAYQTGRGDRRDVAKKELWQWAQTDNGTSDGQSNGYFTAPQPYIKWAMERVGITMGCAQAANGGGFQQKSG